MIAAGLVTASVLTGAAIAVEPAVTLLPGALIITLALVVSPMARLLFVVFGGLATLESSQSLSAAKVAYFAGVGIALAATVAGRLRADASVHPQFRPLRSISGLFFALILVSAAPAIANGTQPTAWLRDVAPYLLFAAVPIFAVETGRMCSEALLLRAFMVAGVLTAISFMVEWLERRHFGNLEINRIVLPSGALSTALFCYAVSRVLHEQRRRAAWFTVTAFLLSIELVTGTRSSLVVLVALPVVALGTKHAAADRLVRLLTFVVPFAITVALLAHGVAKLTGTDLGLATQRLQSIFQPGATLTSDASVRERKTQTRLAWENFRSEPLLGAGPGHAFVWVDQFGNRYDSFTVDSPVSFLAKFGLVGLAALLATAGLVVKFLRRLPSVPPPAGVVRAALMGYAAVWLAFLPLGLPFEDKGFAFGLLFLLALAIAATRRAPEEAPA